jgi:KUP system potassium uptake protein
LLIGLAAFTVLTTWQRGSEVVTRARDKVEGSLAEFVSGIDDARPQVPRVPGTAVFLNRGSATTPLSMRANVDHIHVLQERVLIASVEIPPVPRVPPDQRVTIDHLGQADDGILFVNIRYGYMERPDVPSALQLVDPSLTGGPIDIDTVTYFVSTVDVVPGPEPTLALWRKRLFIAVSHMTGGAPGFFGLPLDRTMIIGSRIAL